MSLAPQGAMNSRTLVLHALLFATVTAACGGSASPTQPGSNSPGTSTGASITGTVRSGASSALTSAGSGDAMPGLIVTVTGTTITSGLDATGRFTLPNVPAGDVQLQFSGPANASLSVSQVKPGETIDLVLSVSTSSAVVESQFRATAGDEQLEGRIESLPPTMPLRSLKVGGRTVTTDDNTQFRQGNIVRTFGDLEVGYRVHVKGRTSNGSMLASSLEIQNVNTTLPVNINGVVSAMSGGSSNFQFEVGGRLVKGDSNTEFFGGSSFSRLQNGARVEVKGQQRDGFVYAERIHVNTDGDDQPQDESASIHGKILSIGGAVPTLTLNVGGTTVRTDGGTVVRRRGDVQTLDTLRTDMDVHVVGVRRADGSLDARMIQINDDEVGGEFEIEGSIGGLSGSCPSVSFKVNGYSVTTTGTTMFDAPCASLRGGMKVKVNGIKQADDSVRATRIRAS
jgi:hypothetical protein